MTPSACVCMCVLLCVGVCKCPLLTVKTFSTVATAPKKNLKKKLQRHVASGKG